MLQKKLQRVTQPLVVHTADRISYIHAKKHVFFFCDQCTVVVKYSIHAAGGDKNTQKHIDAILLWMQSRYIVSNYTLLSVCLCSNHRSTLRPHEHGIRVTDQVRVENAAGARRIDLIGRPMPQWYGDLFPPVQFAGLNDLHPRSKIF